MVASAPIRARAATPDSTIMPNCFKESSPLRYAPGGIRTHDLRLRRPTLYPAELLARVVKQELSQRPPSLEPPPFAARCGKRVAQDVHPRPCNAAPPGRLDHSPSRGLPRDRLGRHGR